MPKSKLKTVRPCSFQQDSCINRRSFKCYDGVSAPRSLVTLPFLVIFSLAYQRMSWEALKKSINGLINKVNISNISIIIQELLQENIVRGR